MKLEKKISIFTACTAFFALLTSIVALWFTIDQGVISREFNRLSLKPHLQVNSKLTGDKETGLYLENARTGAAFIQSIILSIDDKKFDLIENNSVDFFQYIKVKPGCYRESWPRRGAAIQAGKEFALIKVTKANKPLCNLEVMKFLIEPNVKMYISYTSPYDEVLKFDESITLSKRDLSEYYDPAKHSQKINEAMINPDL